MRIHVYADRIAYCKWEEEEARKRTGHPPYYAEAEKTKSLTHTDPWLPYGRFNLQRSLIDSLTCSDLFRYSNLSDHFQFARWTRFIQTAVAGYQTNNQKSMQTRA